MNERSHDLFRDISVKLLFPLFWRSGLSANAITVLNFFTLGLGSVVLFATGHNYIALLTSGLAAMVDYVDGTVARAGRGHPKGAFLDTSLDWLWLMLLIGAISYRAGVVNIGYLALMGLTYGNWVEYNAPASFKLPFPFGVSHLLVISILLNIPEIGITLIMLTQWIRAILMYWRSLWNSS